MNEHDSERIAGLLEDDGYQRASVLEEADVMVLNTCCIRENADNKLYGALGRLKAVKAERPDREATRVPTGLCVGARGCSGPVRLAVPPLPRRWVPGVDDPA